jgi:hypothetical protein
MIVRDLPPGVIPVSGDEYDKLYPQYEKALREGAIPAGTTFQEWLRQQKRSGEQK